MTIKDTRKPWQKQLQNFKFSRDGSMLTTTARAHKASNRRDSARAQQLMIKGTDGSTEAIKTKLKDNGYVFHNALEWEAMNALIEFSDYCKEKVVFVDYTSSTPEKLTITPQLLSQLG